VGGEHFIEGKIVSDTNQLEEIDRVRTGLANNKKAPWVANELFDLEFAVVSLVKLHAPGSHEKALCEMATHGIRSKLAYYRSLLKSIPEAK
jgi:hypothetical protein